jgi:integrase
MSRLIDPSKKKWTDPEICPKNPTAADMKKSWRVRFRFYNEVTKKWEQISRNSDLNQINNFKTRLASAKALKEELIFILGVQGWDPITDSFYTPAISDLPTDMELLALQTISFHDAPDYAYKKKVPDWSYKTGQDYSSVIRYLQQAAKKIQLAGRRIREFKLPHFRMLLDATRDLRKLSNIAYNKYRTYLSSLVTEMIQWDIVELNLVHHVKTKETIKTVAHRPPTDDERLILVHRIRECHRDYYRFIAVIYGCTIRPKEITRLKITHLQPADQAFRIIPDRKEGNSKTNIEREMAIPDWVTRLLCELKLDKYNPELYIFASSEGSGNKIFQPGPKPMHRNTPTRWWNEIVKKSEDEGGLGLQVNQYSLKKLSGDDMIKLQRREGTDKLLELPRQQMGHTTTGQTEDYVTEHLEVMRDLVKRKMPVL